MNKIVISILFLLSHVSFVSAQSDGLPRSYPLEMETWLYHGTYVKITYTKTPTLTGKGEIGTLWHLGSNEPAEIITTGDLLVGVDTLAAGAYSIFTIPNDSTWTIIFNSDVGLFGTYRYNENSDVIRIEGTVSHQQDFSETLKISFSRKGVADSELNIFWRNLLISLPISIIEPEEDD